jgi:hypothetical protein
VWVLNGRRDEREKERQTDRRDKERERREKRERERLRYMCVFVCVFTSLSLSLSRFKWKKGMDGCNASVETKKFFLKKEIEVAYHMLGKPEMCR